MAATTSAITLNGVSLRPAPFVSTSYEYIKSGQYTIGGFLNVTLDGTIVGEDIAQQIVSVSSWQSSNCVSLVIGCEGSADFLTGAGKITEISINRSDDSPFTASYSIVVALETVNGSPAVEPDPEFLSRFGLSGGAYLKSYTEELTVEGDATVVGSYDSVLGISKSFIKASGRISIVSSTTAVCGNPSFNGLNQSINLLNQRFGALLAFNINQPDNPLAAYSGWNKWLDSKSITVDDGGTVSCSFDVYMNQGPCTPMAHIDVRTEDKLDQKTNFNTKSISGTIKGLSSATSSLLDDKTTSNERIGNAYIALNHLYGTIANGAWPSDGVSLTGEEGECEKQKCPPPEKKLYLQRISSNTSVSVVAGEITFSAEFGPVSACEYDNFSIDITREEELPVFRHKEFIVPNRQTSIIQYLGNTPHKATVTVQGSLKNCNLDQKKNLIECVKQAFQGAIEPYRGWIMTQYQSTDSKLGYKITANFIKCEY